MANSSKKKSGLQRGESKAAFLFCTPAVVLALVFIILPFAMSVVYSFTNKQLIPKVGMETAFVGLKNYIEIFTSKVTVLSFKNTFFSFNTLILEDNLIPDKNGCSSTSLPSILK